MLAYVPLLGELVDVSCSKRSSCAREEDKDPNNTKSPEAKSDMNENLIL